MKFINFAIVRFSIFLTIGILSAHFFHVSKFLLLYTIAILFAVAILWFIARRQLIQNIYFGIATYLCFFAIGYVSYQMRLPEFQSKHYSQISSFEDFELLQIKIKESLKPDKFNLKYFAEVQTINSSNSKGKILLNVSKDSLQKSFSPDDVLLVYATISDIPKPLNPHQFNYSAYMKSIEVYGQLRISEKDVLQRHLGVKTLTGIAQNLRGRIIEKLEKTKLKTDERAIIQALILGEKKDIDKNLYDKYAAAGAVHILAVSGLHVGIIYGILLLLFKPLTRWKYGRYFQVILIVFSLWAFAMLTGLSPSVTRSVTMFSFFALAKLLNRETSSINVLFLSFLTLVTINPLLLFQVGFQLSYMAVFFIVWLVPVFQKVGYSKHRLVRNIWSIIAVTLCAQLGVLPLSLYYFHQFPGLFLVTNLVILPILSIIMLGGILIVILATFEILPDWMAENFNTVIEWLNNFIHWVATQDKFLFKDIHFSTLKVLGAYIMIITLGMFFKSFVSANSKMKYRRLVISLLSVSVLISIYIYDDFRTSKSQFVIFHKSKLTLLAYKNGKNLVVFRNDSLENISEKNPIKSFKTGMNAKKNYSEEKLPQIFQYKNNNILILDSLGVIPKRKNIHTVLLTNSPKINLNRIIDSLNPKQIVADGSNYFSYVNRWAETCKLKKLPFSHTAKQGAFSIE